MSERSRAESFFELAWRRASAPLSLPAPVREHRFHPERRWRFDFAWPEIKLAVEIDGRGRHQTVAGFRCDCEKHNTALLMGWRVLRFPATDKAQAPDWAHTVVVAMCGNGK